MADTAKDLLDKSKPWRADVKWQIVAIEAVLLVVIGLFMLISPGSASDWILQLIGLVFLGISLQVAISSFRNAERSLGAFDSFRAGIGVSVGVIATSIWWSESVSNQAARLILGWGLIAYAALHLVGLIAVRGPSGLRPASLVLSGLTLVIGILLLTSDNASSESRITFLGIVLLVFGLLLGGLAFMLRGRDAGSPVNR